MVLVVVGASVSRSLASVPLGALPMKTTTATMPTHPAPQRGLQSPWAWSLIALLVSPDCAGLMRSCGQLGATAS